MRGGVMLIAAMSLLTGCGAGTPEGQVAARVNGIEITDREVLSETASSGADLTMPAVRHAVLDRLIDRKLLASASQEALADRTPAAQIETRRAREDVLARAYARRVTAGVARPTVAEIDRFMRENPHRFAERTSYLIDRVSLASRNARATGDLSVEAAAGMLDRAGTAYRRQLILIDSETIDQAEHRRIAAMSAGQTRHGTTNGDAIIDTLILKQPVVETAEAQRARARTLITQIRSAAAVEAALGTLRARADIAVRPAGSSEKP